MLCTVQFSLVSETLVIWTYRFLWNGNDSSFIETIIMKPVTYETLLKKFCARRGKIKLFLLYLKFI